VTIFIACIALSLALTLLLPRRFYFVRHGETLLNAERVKQGAEGGLSSKGRAQAEEVGRALKGESIDQIISSTYERARETSEIIKKIVHAPVAYSNLFVERRNAREVIGKPVDDPAVKQIVDKIDRAFHDDDYRFSDEENFLDLKNRARKCVNLLAHQGAPRTCVVTHHAFLKMIVAFMLYREDLHAADFVKLSFFNVSDNAGITVCVFRPWNIFTKTRGWSVESYNAKVS
jgi:2,3-bisphosphoglycerate-dependent phosphoglycerate mutase